MAMPGGRAMVTGSWPRYNAEPRVAGISPAMMRSSVDLPQPDWPRMAMISHVGDRQVDAVEDERRIGVASAPYDLTMPLQDDRFLGWCCRVEPYLFSFS